MARSIKIDINQKPKIQKAMQQKGFLTQGYLAANLGIALSTVNNFINAKPIYVSKFEEICDALDLQPIDIIDTNCYQDLTSTERNINVPNNLNYLAYDNCWVGRETLIQSLAQDLKHQTRILLILGLTGIGKTALAENLISHAENWLPNATSDNILRINGEAKKIDFITIATTWLKQWHLAPHPETLPTDVLLEKVIEYCCNQPQMILFDSFEYFLNPDETETENSLRDPLWREFFQNILAAPHCASRILMTSQELPSDIVQRRFAPLWSSQILTGLDITEQKELFTRVGFNLDDHDPAQKILLRIAQAYRGHPLVLRVVLGEIWESFGGNILAYWEEVQAKIETVEQAIAAAEQEATAIIGEGDQWQLHKLTRKVRLEVNRQRLKTVFERLAALPDAYYLICAAAVYRVPVQKQGWLIQLTALTQRLEGKPCSIERQEKALNHLFYRFLIEVAIAPNQKRLFTLHPLVRSVALEHHQALISTLQNFSQSA